MACTFCGWIYRGVKVCRTEDGWRIRVCATLLGGSCHHR